jgi:FkbM family methyltransferase
VKPLRQLVKAGFRALGLSVRRLEQDSRYTLLGLRNRKVALILDIGANEGQFASWISGIFPAATVVCFEPVGAPFAKLSAWAVTTGGRVEAVQVALGDTEGEVALEVHVDHTPSSSMLHRTETSVSLYPHTEQVKRELVRQRRLDDVVEELGLLRGEVGDVLVKLDVQGYEDRVLRGAETTMRRSRYCLIEANLDALYEGQVTFRGLVDALDDLGFEYRGNIEQAFAPDRHVAYVDALFERVKG